ncbi:hypothetical protein N9913_03070 [Porticoccaceae bacterium]|nr:hypothetical protein [Porticoccaceae bacterium]MDB4309269.1 hypothetical protein [Porticoccaceae bacterium]
MSNNILKTLVGYKAWANEALFKKLLSQEDIETLKDTKSIVSTLNHAYVIDSIFKAHLSGTPHCFTEVNTPDQPTLSQLWANVQETDQWYIGYVNSLDNTTLNNPVSFEFTNGQDTTMLRSEIILHVVNHGTYHRGNIGVLMLQNKIIPDKDVITDYLSYPEQRQTAE